MQPQTRIMKPSKTLEVNIDDLKEYLNSNNPVLQEPLQGELRQKQLNLIMACIIAIRTFDRQPRRVSTLLHDTMIDLRDTVEQMDDAKVTELSKKLCEIILTEHNQKTSPIPLECIKIIFLALVDLGVVNPPEKSHAKINEEIKASRMVMKSISENLAKSIESKEAEKKAKEENPDSPTATTDAPPEAPAS